MSKRTLDAFFKPSQAKKPRTESQHTASSSQETIRAAQDTLSTHPEYPFPIPVLPSSVSSALSLDTPAKSPKVINDQPHLDLLYFQPYIPTTTARELFHFLRSELPFYRVRYTIRRGPTETVINTPRFTTVFGVDDTSRFSSNDGNTLLLDSKTSKPILPDKYKCKPRPIPSCLELLRKRVEAVSEGATYNFCLVNYYASGDDSISYHSDDERFLGSNPTVASLSLGAKRDFLMKHKPPAPSTTPMSGAENAKPLKIPLASGDMVIMRGETQSNWLHSIPKRKSGEADRGRINITFRKAVIPGGTENYYKYNVGDEGVFKWDEEKGQMVPWQRDI